MSGEIRRLFFGLEVEAPWPAKLPAGRLLDEKHRHATLAFLGNVNFSKLNRCLESFPKLPFQVGLSGKFCKCLFLPTHHPHVVAWQADWMENLEKQQMTDFQRKLVDWLKAESFHPDDKHAEWLPHITMARTPFDHKQWEDSFTELPFISRYLHLYESTGNLHYEPKWTHTFLAPFQEIEHTADIAFNVRGENIEQLFKNAFIALAFHYPQALAYYEVPQELNHLDDLIRGLNALITKIDGEIGIPLKAVSYHGDINQGPTNALEWEMIVDV